MPDFVLIYKKKVFAPSGTGFGKRVFLKLDKLREQGNDLVLGGKSFFQDIAQYTLPGYLRNTGFDAVPVAAEYAVLGEPLPGVFPAGDGIIKLKREQEVAVQLAIGIIGF